MKAQFPGEETESGEFKRQADAFRQWISNDGSTSYAAEPGRYHLYVSLACPWASRTAIVRKLKGLEEAIGMTVVDPIRDEKGWAFRDPSGKIPAGALFASTDPINGFQFLSEAYRATDPEYDERVTVPVNGMTWAAVPEPPTQPYRPATFHGSMSATSTQPP